MVKHETFGDWLNIEIGRRELSQRGLAARIGVTSGTVSRWVRNLDTPDTVQINRLARELSVKPSYILSLLPEGEELSEQEEFYASLPGDLTDEERRGILAYIRGMRGNQGN